MVQALGEHPFGLPHQPGLHRVADLCWRGAVGQGDVQRQAGHTRQGEVWRRFVGLQHGTHLAKGMARVQHHNHLLAQKRQVGAIPPLDAVGVKLRLAHARFFKFFQHPNGLFLQCGFHLVQRHPLGRTHHEAFRAHLETDGSAAGAPELVGNQRIAQPRFPVCQRVAKFGGRHHIAQRLRLEGRGRRYAYREIN